MGCEGGEECIAQPAGVRRRCVGGGSARGGRVAVRGRAKVFGGEWVVRSAEMHRALRACVGAVWACVGVAWGRAEVLGKGVRKCSGRAKVFGGEWVVRSAGNASHSLRARVGTAWACVGTAWGSRSARGGRVAVRGRAKGFGGEWVVRSAGLTHIRRSSTRARVLLYIRPPCPRREIAAMGPKEPPASTHRPRRLPHPPRPRLHFRARVHTSAPAFTLPRIAFRGPRGAIGLPQQQLSTMGYPRKSYPHRCSPPCAKRSRPRACARVYIIYRSPVGRSRGVSAPLWPRVPRRRAQGGGGRNQRRTPPRAVPNHAACVPNHCAQRRKCTRPTPPLPVRSPRGSLSTAAPLPAYGRTAVCKGGSAPGQPRPCPCVLPATACLPPRPRPLMGEAPSAKAEVHKANPAPARALSPRQLVYGRAPAR